MSTNPTAMLSRTDTFSVDTVVTGSGDSSSSDLDGLTLLGVLGAGLVVVVGDSS